MKSNSLILLSFLTLSIPAFAATRNLCDDLVDSGSSSEQVQKCHDKFGKSDHFNESQKQKEVKVEVDRAKKEETDKKKSNIEFKKFTEADLLDAGFGKPFYAIRGDYRYRKYSEKRITEGDSLCKFLGYEKAVKSIVSPEILPDNADKQGLIVDKNFLGVVSKEPEMYRDEDRKFTVRKYVELTCAKRKDKEVDSTNDMLKEVTEDLVVLNGVLNIGARRDPGVINDASRGSVKEGSTPNGYKAPEWMNEGKTKGK